MSAHVLGDFTEPHIREVRRELPTYGTIDGDLVFVGVVALVFLLCDVRRHDDLLTGLAELHDEGFPQEHQRTPMSEPFELDRFVDDRATDFGFDNVFDEGGGVDDDTVDVRIGDRSVQLAQHPVITLVRRDDFAFFIRCGHVIADDVAGLLEFLEIVNAGLEVQVRDKDVGLGKQSHGKGGFACASTTAQQDCRAEVVVEFFDLLHLVDEWCRNGGFDLGGELDLFPTPLHVHVHDMEDAEVLAADETSEVLRDVANELRLPQDLDCVGVMWVCGFGFEVDFVADSGQTVGLVMWQARDVSGPGSGFEW